MQTITNPAELLRIAMQTSKNHTTLLAAFTYEPELAARTATLFMAEYPNAKASAKTVQAIRSSLRAVPVEDTESPWTILYMKDSRSFILGRATPQAKKEVSDAEQLELDREAINAIYRRRGAAWLVDEALAYAEMDKEAEKEAA
jgi:hypothetical protein